MSSPAVKEIAFSIQKVPNAMAMVFIKRRMFWSSLFVSPLGTRSEHSNYSETDLRKWSQSGPKQTVERVVCGVNMIPTITEPTVDMKYAAVQ